MTAKYLKNIKKANVINFGLLLVIFLLLAVLVLYRYDAVDTSSNEASYLEPATAQKLHEDMELATLAGGCFRCIEQAMQQLEGVTDVVVGYAGGDRENPTYQLVAGGLTKHTETAQIYFDSNVVSYREIIDFYRLLIDPSDMGGQFVDRGPQYRPVIFYHDAEQHRVALESKAALQATSSEPVVTPILPYKNFYLAEEYHQDYFLKEPESYKAYKDNSGR